MVQAGLGEGAGAGVIRSGILHQNIDHHEI